MAEWYVDLLQMLSLIFTFEVKGSTPAHDSICKAFDTLIRKILRGPRWPSGYQVWHLIICGVTTVFLSHTRGNAEALGGGR